jgi:hypothetical protein
MGNMWAQLSCEERAAYRNGLTPVPAVGRGGFRAWTAAQPTKVSRQEPNAPPSAHPVDQRALQGVRVQRALQQGLETTSRPVQLETMIEGASFAPVPESPAKAAVLPPPDCRQAVRPSFTTASRNKRKYMRAASERKAYHEALALGLAERAAPLYNSESYRIRESAAAACQLLQHLPDPPPFCSWMPPSHGAARPFPVVSRSPLPTAVEPAVAPHAGEGAGGGPGGADLSRPGEGSGEGGFRKGDLDRILQEQLARLRSSWYCS